MNIRLFFCALSIFASSVAMHQNVCTTDSIEALEQNLYDENLLKEFNQLRSNVLNIKSSDNEIRESQKKIEYLALNSNFGPAQAFCGDTAKCLQDVERQKFFYQRAADNQHPTGLTEMAMYMLGSAANKPIYPGLHYVDKDIDKILQILISKREPLNILPPESVERIITSHQKFVGDNALTVKELESASNIINDEIQQLSEAPKDQNSIEKELTFTQAQSNIIAPIDNYTAQEVDKKFNEESAERIGNPIEIKSALEVKKDENTNLDVLNPQVSVKPLEVATEEQGEEIEKVSVEKNDAQEKNPWSNPNGLAAIKNSDMLPHSLIAPHTAVPSKPSQQRQPGMAHLDKSHKREEKSKFTTSKKRGSKHLNSQPYKIDESKSGVGREAELATASEPVVGQSLTPCQKQWKDLATAMWQASSTQQKFSLFERFISGCKEVFSKEDLESFLSEAVINKFIQNESAASTRWQLKGEFWLLVCQKISESDLKKLNKKFKFSSQQKNLVAWAKMTAWQSYQLAAQKNLSSSKNQVESKALQSMLDMLASEIISFADIENDSEDPDQFCQFIGSIGEQTECSQAIDLLKNYLDYLVKNKRINDGIKVLEKMETQSSLLVFIALDFYMNASKLYPEAISYVDKIQKITQNLLLDHSAIEQAHKLPLVSSVVPKVVSKLNSIETLDVKLATMLYRACDAGIEDLLKPNSVLALSFLKKAADQGDAAACNQWLEVFCSWPEDKELAKSEVQCLKNYIVFLIHQHDDKYKDVLHRVGHKLININHQLSLKELLNIAQAAVTSSPVLAFSFFSEAEKKLGAHNQFDKEEFKLFETNFFSKLEAFLKDNQELDQAEKAFRYFTLGGILAKSAARRYKLFNSSIDELYQKALTMFETAMSLVGGIQAERLKGHINLLMFGKAAYLFEHKNETEARGLLESLVEEDFPPAFVDLAQLLIMKKEFNTTDYSPLALLKEVSAMEDIDDELLVRINSLRQHAYFYELSRLKGKPELSQMRQEFIKYLSTTSEKWLINSVKHSYENYAPNEIESLFKAEKSGLHYYLMGCKVTTQGQKEEALGHFLAAMEAGDDYASLPFMDLKLELNKDDLALKEYSDATLVHEIILKLYNKYCSDISTWQSNRQFVNQILEWLYSKPNNFWAGYYLALFNFKLYVASQDKQYCKNALECLKKAERDFYTRTTSKTLDYSDMLMHTNVNVIFKGFNLSQLVKQVYDTCLKFKDTTLAFRLAEVMADVHVGRAQGRVQFLKDRGVHCLVADKWFKKAHDLLPSNETMRRKIADFSLFKLDQMLSIKDEISVFKLDQMLSIKDEISVEPLEKLLSNACEIAPDYSLPYYRRGTFYFENPQLFATQSKDKKKLLSRSLLDLKRAIESEELDKDHKIYACNLLGGYYSGLKLGWYSSKQLNEAITYLTKAIELGSTEALRKLAVIYSREKSHLDLSKAVDYFERLRNTEDGNNEDRLNYYTAKYLLHCESPNSDFAQLRDEFLEVIKQEPNSIVSQLLRLHLSVMAYDGEGSEESFDKALEYFEEFLNRLEISHYSVLSQILKHFGLIDVLEALKDNKRVEMLLARYLTHLGTATDLFDLNQKCCNVALALWNKYPVEDFDKETQAIIHLSKALIYLKKDVDFKKLTQVMNMKDKQPEFYKLGMASLIKGIRAGYEGGNPRSIATRNLTDILKGVASLLKDNGGINKLMGTLINQTIC